MAASETVRLRLQFDYPPPGAPHCTSFWLLIDLNGCRVVTDLISLIRQRFGFSSGALLGLYLEGALLPPAESARLVRDNDCLRVKLEERGIAESPVTVSNGDSTRLLPRKAKKRAFKLDDEETELDYRNSKKHWKRHENNNSEKTLDLEPKAATDQSVSKKNKRRNKATCDAMEADDGETEKKVPKKKEKREYKKHAKTPKSSQAQSVKEWTIQKCSPKAPPARNSLVKANRKGGMAIHTKDSPESSSESESYHESTSDGLSNVTLEVRHASEKISTDVSKDGSSVKTTAANRVAPKTGFASAPVKGKTSRTSSSSSDSSSESDDQCVRPKSTPECTAELLKTVGLFVGRNCPGPSSQVPNAAGWKQSDPNSGSRTQTVLCPPPNVTLPASLGRGWGRGEDLLSWKGARGRGTRGRGRGRGHAVPYVLNRNAGYQKQQQLNEMVTNSSTIIQNPIETHKKDYSLLPLLAAAPQVGEKIAFKYIIFHMLEGRILSHNPETQQVDIEILSSLPAMKEPGKFDLVYHNENGAEVVEYAVTQEKRITVLWRELIDPRLIIESPSNT
uniref:Coilin N-terminal domain-containing protein n=1 Tax=Moschus moschiferus TaxID=68415 RepID=A0A8C6FN03_MOSMO